jgi:putative oxygen-independent coproporphyrinogen III oxidase
VTVVRSRVEHPSVWTADPGFGVYVHTPFCLHRCHYCDFNTYTDQGELHDAYVDALVRHVDDVARSRAHRTATSVFFGGGTPTVLPVGSLARVLGAVRRAIGVSDDAEVTVEVNPETVDRRSFDKLLGAGFNRVSIGVQSLVSPVLARLGRTHSPQRALDAIADARRAGVDNINADLIYGSPWESTSEWETTLDRIVDAGVDHISAYALTVEQGTPLATLVATNRCPDVDPDVQADRHAMAEEILGAAGFNRYEVSNWSVPGCESRHNMLYWCAGDYAGFGAGAHAHYGGRRSWSVRLPREFIARVRSGRSVEAGHEVLSAAERVGEALMLGLRLTNGIEVAAFERRFGSGALGTRAEALSSLQAGGLIECGRGRIRVAPAATLLGNEIGSRLL